MRDPDIFIQCFPLLFFLFLPLCGPDKYHITAAHDLSRGSGERAAGENPLMIHAYLCLTYFLFAFLHLSLPQIPSLEALRYPALPRGYLLRLQCVCKIRVASGGPRQAGVSLRKQKLFLVRQRPPHPSLPRVSKIVMTWVYGVFARVSLFLPLFIDKLALFKHPALVNI